MGFCVARSTEMGNAKASKCGTGGGKDSHAFCVYDKELMNFKTLPTWESVGTKQVVYERTFTQKVPWAMYEFKEQSSNLASLAGFYTGSMCKFQ